MLFFRSTKMTVRHPVDQGAIVDINSNVLAFRLSDAIVLVLQLVFASIVVLPIFLLNRRNLLSYIDGQYLLTLIDSRRLFSAGFPGFSTNPLQGLGDLWYFANTSLIPEFLVGRLVDTPAIRVAVINTAAFVEMFLAVALLSYWLKGCIRIAIASAWLSGLIIFPLAFPPLIYNISSDSPLIAFLTAVPMMLVLLVFALGRGSLWQDAALSCTIVVLMWIHFLAIGLFVALTYPFVAFAGIASLVQYRSDRRIILRKIICVLFILTMLVASGMPLILLSFVSDTAFQFFQSDVTRAAHPLAEGSILFQTDEPVGVVIAACGVTGAIHSAIYERGYLRAFGQAACALVACIVAGSLLYWAIGVRGAKPIYYEYVLWPVYPIFTVLLLARWGRWIGRLLPTMVGLPHSAVRRSAWVALPLLAIAALHGPNAIAHRDNERPNVYPPKPSSITELLRQSIGLAPDAPFNGRVVTMTGTGSAGGTSWDDAFRYDLNIIPATGNEHRTIGLWYYNIPTLMEFSHTVRPLLFAVTKTFLAHEAEQRLNLLSFSKPDLRVLRLLGVRYLITDQADPPDGAKRLLMMSVTDRLPPLALDELERPNIGVSPTRIVVREGEAAMQMLDEADFDFETIAILPEAIATPLTKAEAVKINIVPGGIRIRANSSGTSLVVLPFQYSHCLRAISRMGGDELPLIRGDFLLTGIVFNGTLDADIVYRQGPFVGQTCGLSDLSEDRQALKQNNR